MTYEDLSKYSKLQKELRLLGSGVRGQNKVSGLAKDLASKLSGEGSKPLDEPAEVRVLYFYNLGTHFVVTSSILQCVVNVS